MEVRRTAELGQGPKHRTKRVGRDDSSSGLYRLKKWKLAPRSCLFETPWTVAPQAPLSMGFPRQDYWSGLPYPPPGYLPNPGIEPGFPALQADSLSPEPPGKPLQIERGFFIPLWQPVRRTIPTRKALQNLWHSPRSHVRPTCCSPF